MLCRLCHWRFGGVAQMLSLSKLWHFFLLSRRLIPLRFDYRISFSAVIPFPRVTKESRTWQLWMHLIKIYSSIFWCQIGSGEVAKICWKRAIDSPLSPQIGGFSLKQQLKRGSFHQVDTVLRSMRKTPKYHYFSWIVFSEIKILVWINLSR